MSPNYNTILISVIGILMTFFLARLTFKLNEKAAETKKDKERIAALETAVAVMSAEAKPAIATYLAMSIAKLTHFHTPDTDKILEKIVTPFNQTEEEIAELKVAMEERMADPSVEIDEAEKIHAKILPDLIKLAHMEALEIAKEIPKAVIQIVVPAEVAEKLV